MEALQTDILAKASVLTSLGDAAKNVETFETAQRDQTRLHSHPDAIAVTHSHSSSYFRLQALSTWIIQPSQRTKGTEALHFVLHVAATFTVKKVTTITQRNALPGGNNVQNIKLSTTLHDYVA